MRPRRVPDLGGQSSGTREAGFTLLELLVVVLIVGLVSVVALPTIIPALQSRQVSEAGRILQGALVGARDKAIHDGTPSGIRLLPDPAFPLRYLPNGQLDPIQVLAYDRIIPIGPAPNYSEGALLIATDGAGGSSNYPATIRTVNGYSGVPCLVIEQAVTDARGAPNAPTSWSWNVRVGDKIQVNNTGPWYTICGPMTIGPAGGNSEMFVNIGPPGTSLPKLMAGVPAEFLLLVNGRDDDGNGYIDSGFDGVDNDGALGIDEHAPGTTATVTPIKLDGTPLPPVQVHCDEWEQEQWLGSISGPLVSVPYLIRRRPMVLPGSREVALPTRMVIDPARSQLPVNPYTGSVEILVNPDGTAQASIPYGTPSVFSWHAAYFHFALVDRTDVGTGIAPKAGWSMFSINARSGRTVVIDEPDPANPFALAQHDQP